jgi:hypothetical protein
VRKSDNNTVPISRPTGKIVANQNAVRTSLANGPAPKEDGTT